MGKKSKYRTAESRVSLFLAKLHLRPFPKENESQRNAVSAANEQLTDANANRVGSELTPAINNKTIGGADFDYRLSEKQLDSEFDLYFNTGGFFSDANSSTTATSDIPQPITTNQVV